MPSAMDEKIIMEHIIRPASIAAPFKTYDEEIKAIQLVQQSILKLAPLNEGIPLGRPREPATLIEAGKGLCYDRSRVIEKSLRLLGFAARHISIYSTTDVSALEALITPGTSSHAVTEVLTSRGWLVVDSNSPWLSLTSEGVPVSMSVIKNSVGAAIPISWQQEPPSDIYKKPFVYVCGLYSRHGRFYPPFDAFPDVNYSEMLSCARG